MFGFFRLAALRCGLAVAVYVLIVSFGGLMARAETWSDTTGKFKLEAEYAGIEGKSVVLRRADGKTVAVPIANLSAESRAQAKAHYQKSKAAGGSMAKPGASTPTTATVASYTPKKRELKFPVPSVPAIKPMSAFPENASLQETLDFVRAQALAGHLEVFWLALPEDMRQTAESSELREGLRPALTSNAQTTNEVVAVMDKLLEVLITKKSFVMKSPILAQVPPEAMPLIEAGYEPVTGIIYEYSEMAVNTEGIVNASLTSYLSYHLPRIGAHVQSLVNLVPAPLRDSFVNGITAAQTDDASGTITWPKQDGTTESVDMVKTNGRWIPKSLAEEWAAKKDTLVQDAIAAATANQDAGKTNPQLQAMTAGMVKQADAVLDPLIAAKTQQEFDFALGQVMMPLMMAFGGGAGPGAAPPAENAFDQ